MNRLRKFNCRVNLKTISDLSFFHKIWEIRFGKQWKAIFIAYTNWLWFIFIVFTRDEISIHAICEDCYKLTFVNT